MIFKTEIARTDFGLFLRHQDSFCFGLDMNWKGQYLPYCKNFPDVCKKCDFWDIWSEWWGDMSWPKKTQRQIHLENTLKEQFCRLVIHETFDHDIVMRRHKKMNMSKSQSQSEQPFRVQSQRLVSFERILATLSFRIWWPLDHTYIFCVKLLLKVWSLYTTDVFHYI